MADINVFGTLHAATGEGVVVRAAQVLDEALNKKQHLINQEVSTHEATLSIHSNILKGKSSDANARQNAFVDLGSFGTWAAVNAALDGLMADRTANKYNGRLKFDVTGGNYEVVMFIRAWNNAPKMPVWVQRVSGPLSLSSGLLASGDAYAEYVRYSDASGTVSAWSVYPDLSGLEADVAAETSRATAAEAAILATALGTGAENAYDVPMKVEKVTGVQMNARLNELILSRRGQQTNGLYRFEHAQGHQAFLLMGGNVINDTPTTANAATQILIGNVGVSTGEQYIDEDAGFTNGASFSAAKSGILMRRINYTGNGTEYTVTQWTNKLSL